MNRCVFLLCVIGASYINCNAQQFSISGAVYDERGKEILIGATVKLSAEQARKDSIVFGGVSDDKGSFVIDHLYAGKYRLQISYTGFDIYKRTIEINDKDIMLGKILLQPGANTLNEVKVVEKIMAVVQRDDTTEFNAGAYKTHPDADASDLVKKMPGVEINGKDVKAHGESVTKIIVDGKPFFGNDPYATLSNLPADIIDKVQVYNEKSEQEQFTGFNEGTTTKTINIITKKDKRKGVFGKMAAAYGGDEDAGRYALGGNMHSFNNDQRVSVNLQTNNINLQNFGDQDIQGIPKSSGAGTAKVSSGGINYSGKWGSRIDISGSYFVSNADNSTARQQRRQYILANDSGQVYNEQSNNNSTNYSHRFNLRINYNIDSLNLVLVTPQLSLQQLYSLNSRGAYTTQADSFLNASNNNTDGNTIGYNFNTSVLFRHRFRKKGRSLSVNIAASDNNNMSDNTMQAVNIFYNNRALDDTLNQKSSANQNSWALRNNITYTEPVGKRSLLQIQYNYNDVPATSERDVYNYSGVTNNYTLIDTTLSSTFNSRTIEQKAGGSYQYSEKKINVSLGLYYQYSSLDNTQTLPHTNNLQHSFEKVLPVASLQYKFSDRQNIHINYSTNTSVPSVNQLQDVVSNANPLQLSTGNPSLQEPYQHGVVVRYNNTNTARRTTFNVSLTGNIIQNQVTSNTIIAAHDTMVKNILLAQGGQITMPVNVNGYKSIRGNITYGLPIALIKCNLNLNLNAGYILTPGIINNAINNNEKKTAGIGVNLNSNISEHVDFIIASNTNINNDVSTLNTNLNNTYINQGVEFRFNWVSKSGFVFNTEVNYQSNSGNASGYNTDFTVWNMSIGQKILKKKRGDIRFTVYDILNQNTNIQHVVTETYISDVHSNLLQRYYMLTFTYKIREFRK